MNIERQRLQLALELLGPDNGTDFEQFGNSFIASEFNNLRPIAGMHDGARDAFLYSSIALPHVFVQHSVQKNWEQKIRNTVSDLRKNGHDVRELIYCSPKDIQRDADKIKATMRTQGVSLDIRDINYFVTMANTTRARVAASEELAQKFVNPVLAERRLIESTGVLLTTEEEQLAAAYLQIALEDKDPSKELPKFAYESLVMYVLRNSSASHALSRSDIVTGVGRFITQEDDLAFKTKLEGTMERMLKRKVIKKIAQADSFYLRSSYRLQLADRVSALVINTSEILREIEDRVKLAHTELKINYVVPHQDVAQDVLKVCDRFMFDRGKAAAEALAKGQYFRLDTLAFLDEITSYITNAPKDFASLQSLSREHFLDIVPPVVESVLVTPSIPLRKRLTCAVDAYCLLFVLREAPDVQAAITKVLGQATCLTDTSVIVRCMAEELLPDTDRRMTNLLRAAQNAGVRLVIDEDFLKEIHKHIQFNRLSFRNQTLNRIRSLGRQSAELVEPPLISAYLAATDNVSQQGFDDFLDRFVGKADPERDLIEYLKYNLDIEYCDFREVMQTVTAQELDELCEKWEKAKPNRPHIDESTKQLLVRNDARALLAIEKLRAKEKAAESSQYGHAWWWLTLGTTSYRMDHLRRNGKGDSYCMSPDFFARYLSMRAKPAAEKTEQSSLLPLTIEIAGLGLVPDELRDQAAAALAELKESPPYLQRRKLRELANRAKSSRLSDSKIVIQKPRE
jgi:hypothetical protein